LITLVLTLTRGLLPDQACRNLLFLAKPFPGIYERSLKVLPKGGKTVTMPMVLVNETGTVRFIL
jgi:hypothetical protein